MFRDELEAVISAQILELLVEIIIPPGGEEIVDSNDNARGDKNYSGDIFFHEDASEVDRTGN